MNWAETRKKLFQLTAGRNPRTADERPTTAARAAPPSRREGAGRDPVLDPARVPARSICIASGKGGTGKSVVSASLASLLAVRGRTLLVDADFGVGNAHILQDTSPATTCVDVVEGRCSVEEALHACNERLTLLGAGSGVPHMTELSSYEMRLLATGLADVEQGFRYVVVDSAAGVSGQTMAFARAADLTVLVTTPDLTAMTDAYAFLKLLVVGRPGAPVQLLVNRAANENEAHEVAQRIARVSERFLGAAPRLVGWLPNDTIVSSCVNRRGPFVQLEPGAECSRALRRLAGPLWTDLEGLAPRGLGARLVGEIPDLGRSG
jgi:flagellar biosynthesis protein FlhG